MSIIRRLYAYARLARLDKPAGWLLLLWPTMWAVWAAVDGQPEPGVVGLFVGGVVLTRSLGCCVNDIADRKLDAQVERTRSRPLAAGEISVAEAVTVAVVFAACCGLLWLQLEQTAKLWALGALAIALTYPLAKRVISVPQLHLGVAFGMGIPVAYAHQIGEVPWQAWLLFGANFFWVVAYDTIYAMADREDDLRAGVKSSAIWLGKQDVLAVALCYFLMLALLLVYGIATEIGVSFLLVCGLCFFPAYKFTQLAAKRDPASCTRSFQRNHWLGALIMLGLAASYGS